MGSNLCETCSVLQLNDELLAPHILDRDGAPALPSPNQAPLKMLPLDYRVCDFLPTLPCLDQSADRGCDFCSLLRQEIIRAGFDYRGFVYIRLIYNWGQQEFPGPGMAGLVAELEWRPDIPSIPPSSRPPDRSRGYIIFTLETDDAPVASWLGIPRLRKEVVLCEDNVQFMKNTITRCVSECSHADAGGFLPTRLLDLGPGGYHDSVRLVTASDALGGSSTPSEAPKYAALSYCWGPPAKGVQPCTVKGNLEARKTGITELTSVLRDAIRVCRSLGIRYLWIDALCIVQDDVADWERESASMALVYEETAGSSPSPFVPDIGDTVWASRGWTLQDKLMSVRKLVFGHSMIHFQCGNIGLSENDCQHVGERSQDGNFLEPGVFASTAKSLSDYHDEWNGVVLADYGRNYTKAQDRLPGISGMAKRVAELSGDEYLAGLWRADMPYALLWFAYVNLNPEYRVEVHELVDRLCSPCPYITPSWSPMRLAGVRTERGLSYKDLSRGSVSAECTVLEARAACTGLNPFGTLKEGLLRIRGRFTRVPSDMIPLECHVLLPRLLYLEDRGFTVAYCNVDWHHKGPVPRGELSMLLVASTGGTTSLHEAMHQNHLESESGCPCGDPSIDGYEAASASGCGSDASGCSCGDGIDGYKAASASGCGSDASGDYVESEDEGERDAWGLLLHPAKERRKFVRVGIWASVDGDGAGMRYFEQFESREVEIV